jgi:kynurenine formamidase
MSSGVENPFNPLHEPVMVGMGMPVFDNMDLRAVSELARQHQRSSFVLVAAPLKVEGATGSPLNPIAIF